MKSQTKLLTSFESHVQGMLGCFEARERSVVEEQKITYTFFWAFICSLSEVGSQWDEIKIGKYYVCFVRHFPVLCFGRFCFPMAIKFFWFIVLKLPDTFCWRKIPSMHNFSKIVPEYWKSVIKIMLLQKCWKPWFILSKTKKDIVKKNFFWAITHFSNIFGPNTLWNL